MSNGTANLTNTGNSFAGNVSGTTGTLNFALIADSGVNSAFGAGTSISINNYTLNFNGVGAQSSNRGFTLTNSFATLRNNAANAAHRQHHHPGWRPP